MAWSVVVVAPTGSALLDVPFPRVRASEDFLEVLAASPILSLMTDAVSMAVLLADEMLSRAIWVTGAAFLGQVLLYHEDRLGAPFCGWPVVDEA